MSGEVSSTAPARIIPALGEHNRPFWTGGADGRLHIAHCDSCHRWVHPPSKDCPDCGGGLVARPVSGFGTVLTYTVNRHPFNPAVPLPYVVAIVELIEQEGLRVATNIVDCEPDSVVIGMPVEVRFEEQKAGDDTAFVPVFAPRQSQSA
jgi:uncharacterized protein